jgi:DNA-binding IclR family transcriptional regulator
MCDETVQIVVLDRGDAFYLDKIKGKKPIRVASSIGQRLFAHCSGVGKVLLASLAEEEVNRIVREKGLKRQTCNTITDPSVLKGELARVRKRGYAIDNEESKMGLKCLAVPVSHSDGNVIAAISNAALKERFGKKVIKHFIPIIKAISSEISKVLEKRNFGVVH